MNCRFADYNCFPRLPRVDLGCGSCVEVGCPLHRFRYHSMACFNLVCAYHYHDPQISRNTVVQVFVELHPLCKNPDNQLRQGCRVNVYYCIDAYDLLFPINTTPKSLSRVPS
jgi:hypothetical protein